MDWGWGALCLHQTVGEALYSPLSILPLPGNSHFLLPSLQTSGRHGSVPSLGHSPAFHSISSPSLLRTNQVCCCSENGFKD